MVFIRSSELTHFKIYPLTNIYFPLLRPLTITILLFRSPEPWLWTAFLLHSSWLSLLDELRERCNLNSWRNQALTPTLSLSLVGGSEAEQGFLAAELGCPGGGVIRLNESIVINLFRMYSLRLFFFFFSNGMLELLCWTPGLSNLIPSSMRDCQKGGFGKMAETNKKPTQSPILPFHWCHSLGSLTCVFNWSSQLSIIPNLLWRSYCFIEFL